MKVLLLGSGGFWAKNVLKNLEKINDLEIVCVEPNEKVWVKKYTTYSNITEALMLEDGIKLAFVCTPISTHHSVTKQLLENNINCLTQKPLAVTVEQAKELVDLAAKNKLTLMVAHTFLFSPAIKTLKLNTDLDNLGKLLFFHATWMNLGLFQRDSDVILDLSPHPFSILQSIRLGMPAFVSAVGTSHSKTNYINSVNISLGYFDNFQAYIHLNWLSPVKTRQITVAGDKKMAVYDDASNDEKLKIYDCGFDEDEKSRFSYRKGDILIPKIEESEAIYNEIKHFISCVKDNIECISSGQIGFEVVELIEAAQKSVSLNGCPIYL